MLIITNKHIAPTELYTNTNLYLQTERSYGAIKAIINNMPQGLAVYRTEIINQIFSYKQNAPMELCLNTNLFLQTGCSYGALFKCKSFPTNRTLLRSFD